MWADEKMFLDAWNAMIIEATKTQYNHIKIFVAQSYVDSVASIKILTKLLRFSSTTYSILTVRNWADLQEKIQLDPSDDATILTKSMIALLLNCGVTGDLNGLNVPHIRFFVIDAHRPIYHGNLLCTNKSVVVFLSIDYENEKLTTLINKLYTIEKEQKKNNRISTNLSKNSGKTEKDLTEQTHQKNTSFMFIKSYEGFETFLSDYYQRGYYIGTPVSKIAHKISQCLRKSDVKDLWYAIVGTTDFFLHGMMTFSLYKRFYDEFSILVSRVRIGIKYCYSESYSSEKNNTKIQPCPDYRLPLLRHWTLLDSCINSIYIGTRLQTYSDSGISVVKSWLTKTGLTSRDWVQLWQDLPPKLKPTVLARLVDSAKSFNIPDIEFPSFSYTDFYSTFMATDIVYITRSLLERDAQADNLISANINNFFEALDMLDLTDERDIKNGLDLAKELHRSLISMAGTTLDRKEVQLFGSLRVYFLSPIRAKHDNKVFRKHPEGLKKLAFFIQNCHTQQTGCSTGCVLVTNPDDEEFCQIVISLGQNMNTLTPLIIRAAELATIKYRIEEFDNSIIKIKSESIPSLFDQLQRICIKSTSFNDYLSTYGT
eukprot:gnl/MRDRNA2_/MRDRNA2_86233_c0_seq1.p1 gnl/MRDRNA2_/MRDRNA2_86233_c0~~gnl/MRDRNA2_/MRDRNA2_86233_c0_seq1.p1  ORF type:complete len:598 (+),score=-8.74 gnl/MRDRNA2_/MRDRNA2_86233_c0_seq1:57-1850(+)